MTSLIVYCAIGAGLLVLLLLALLRRPSRPEGSAEALLEARHALRTLQLGLLPQELVGRFFARNDLEYVVANAPKTTEQLFLEERKHIVLAWISQVRLQIVSLQNFHFGHSRHFVQVSLTSEIALAWEFATLRMVCRALYLLVYFRGPYGAQQIAGKMVAIAARVCALSEKSLAFLSPAESHALVDNSARGSAPV
jgi:hypothetical protein